MTECITIDHVMTVFMYTMVLLVGLMVGCFIGAELISKKE